MCISDEIKERIDSMTHEEMALLLRFGSSDDEIFRGDNYTYLKERFDALGGMTPEMSKRIGW